RPEGAVNFWSTISHPGLSFLQDPRSSGQLLSARGPSEPSAPCGDRTRDLAVRRQCKHLSHRATITSLSYNNKGIKSAISHHTKKKHTHTHHDPPVPHTHMHTMIHLSHTHTHKKEKQKHVDSCAV